MYLLTEIALEMLGYKYFDPDGKPCAIKFEKQNNSNYVYLEDEKNLKEILGIEFDDDVEITNVEPCNSTMLDVDEGADKTQQSEASAADVESATPAPAAAITKHAQTAMHAIDKLVAANNQQAAAGAAVARPNVKRKAPAATKTKTVYITPEQNNYDDFDKLAVHHDKLPVRTYTRVSDDEKPTTSAAAARNAATERPIIKSAKTKQAEMQEQQQTGAVAKKVLPRRNRMAMKINTELDNIRQNVLRNKVIFQEQTDFLPPKERGNTQLQDKYNAFETDSLQKELQNMKMFEKTVEEELKTLNEELFVKSHLDFGKALDKTTFDKPDADQK